MSFFEELKRRNVFRAGIAYAITGWLIAQIAGLAADSFGAPEWVMKMLITILLLGFPIAMVLAWAYELTPGGLRRDSGHDTNQPANTGKLDRTIIIALAAALAYFAYDKFVLDPGRDAALLESAAMQPGAPDAGAQPGPDPESSSPPSIAVLPFVNMSDDPGNEYFADGISEELLNILVKIPELRVAARTSSFSFRSKDLTIADIAQKLNVSYILEGSVRKSGDLVRITAQLIKADDGFHLWSETFDRTLDDIFAVQDEISRQVSQALKVTLLGEAKKMHAVNAESYALSLRGLHFLRQRGPDNMTVARGHLEEAVETDPANALAWHLLASVYTELMNYGQMPRQEGVPLVRTALDTAQRLDPENAVVWALAGYIRKNLHWDWDGARADLDKAYAMEPNNETIIGWRASLAVSLGRFDEAVQLYEMAYTLNPLSLSLHSALGQAYLKVGRHDEAIRIFEKQLELAPDYYWARANLGKAYIFKGDPERGLLEIRKNPDNEFKAVNLVVAYHSLGLQNETRTGLENMVAEYGSGGFATSIAAAFAWLGQNDKAFEWLEFAYREKNAGIAYMLGEKLFYPVLDDPRWAAFLQKVGLYEYWLEMPAKYGGPQP